MKKRYFKGSQSLKDFFGTIKYKINFAKEHPHYFNPEGLLIFCGAQGQGKTLSAVQYIKNICAEYPKAILVTNTTINGLPDHTEVIEYDGIESLKTISNGEYGVIYFIDEIHLEFNSLESKNIDIDVMIEIAQQRKQRKHIVGTTQIYMRMAKPLREQVRNIVLCRKVLGQCQFNKLIDGLTAVEENGKLKANVRTRTFFFHTPENYGSYDTFAKMKRYNDLWQGAPRKEIITV